MNDQTGGFDLYPFGLDTFTPQQVQQQQVPQMQQPQQHGYISNHGNANINASINGPCMDGYDPNHGLMPAMHTSPYNSITEVGGQHSRSNSHTNGIHKNSGLRNSQNRRHHSRTHQVLMPSSIAASSRGTSSSSQSNSHHHSQQQQQQQQQQQHSYRHHLQTGLTDFEPIPIKNNIGGNSSNRGGIQQQLHSAPPNSINTNSNNTSTMIHRGAVQVSYGQQQQQSYQISSRNSLTTEEVPSSVTSFYSTSSLQQSNQYKQRHRKQRPSKPKTSKEKWLETLQIEVPGVSLTPMSGSKIIQLLKERTNQVLTRYLPCVDFLVQCQQELRRGLQEAQTKQYVHHIFRETLTPREFHEKYISDLPERFYRKNKRTMTEENINTAYKELQKLVNNAKEAESQGCEVVKNTFLGGMKDGESWGLRKWLSKQGGALHICNDTECLSTACQKLDRDLESTRKLAEKLRPLASAALKKLKSEIPSSYQEQSSAHPYLPFFHRLECALRGMANFDPEDDDVICIIDDDEVEKLKAKASSAPATSNKRKRSRTAMSGSSDGGKKKEGSTKRKAVEEFVSAGNEDGDSDIEVLERKPPPRRSNTKKISMKVTIETNNHANNYGLGESEDAGDESGLMQELLNSLDDDTNEVQINFDEFERKNEFEEEALDDQNGASKMSNFDASELADGLDSLASLFDTNQHDKVRPDDIKKDYFWDDSVKYASALRLFSQILRAPDCSSMYLESIDDNELIQEGKLPYTEIVRHPLCFRDIASSLLQDFNRVDNSIECSSGILPFGTTLPDWNMWKGNELLQAIDLVFLNSLAYGKANDGAGKSNTRSRTNKLRKLLWAGIKGVIDDSLTSSDADERRKCTPKRRGESSGFVVRKGST
mmetsp:Transcript_9076/g.22218  ORF Transcript_9076/g.22218 Transcript_9076/m.22218 type:complete len:878 (-) Transcript_9076:269-2902(-)